MKRILFEPPATVELGHCFQLVIMLFYDSLSTTLELRVFKPWFLGLPRIGWHSICCDSHVKLVWMELNTFKPWLVRPANESFVRLGVISQRVRTTGTEMIPGYKGRTQCPSTKLAIHITPSFWSAVFF